MARLVHPVPRKGELFAATDSSGKAQEYAERVAKYVPAEVIAAYLTLLPIVLSGTDPDSDRRELLLGVIFGIGVIFTPLYLRRFPGERKVKTYHLVISTIAFVIWSYVIPNGFLAEAG